MTSIRSYLVVTLVAAFSLITFLAALNGYLSSMREAERLLDTELAHANDILSMVFVGSRKKEVVRQQSDDLAFQVWKDDDLVMASSEAPGEPLGDLDNGYRYINFSGYRWRSFTRSDAGYTYVVAERADLRHLVAEKVVLESVLPLLLWLPVSAVLVWVLVSWGLRPLRELSTQINQRRSDDLAPLVLQNPPGELVQLIDSSNSLLVRLSAAFEREKHFASHAAHELRTPLSILKVHLHNIAQEVPKDDPALMHANAGVERMHHLVEQILDLNRTNPELMKANFQIIDLHRVAQRVTAGVWPEFESSGLTLGVEGASAAMPGDAALLETLMHNLLDNARKYTPALGQVRVSVEACDDIVVLKVEDSGPGIPDAVRDRVFERFYRAVDQDAGGYTGSGLGLAIVQHIAQVHAATIYLDDSELGGLCVRLVFPASKAHA